MKKGLKSTVANTTASTDLYSKLFADSSIMYLIRVVRKGIKFKVFDLMLTTGPFTMKEWANYLHLSERTLQRYRKEKKVFEPLQSEKILELALLQKRGIEVFGNPDKFNLWIETVNIALGSVKPKELLDNSFGIELIKDELTRIEHGVLA